MVNRLVVTHLVTHLVVAKKMVVRLVRVVKEKVKVTVSCAARVVKVKVKVKKMTSHPVATHLGITTEKATRVLKVKKTVSHPVPRLVGAKKTIKKMESQIVGVYLVVGGIAPATIIMVTVVLVIMVVIGCAEDTLCG